MADPSDLIYLEAASVCAAIAAFTDVRARRIPNWLTGPGFLLGLALHLAFGGVRQAAFALVAGLFAGTFFFLFFIAGGMGAGDVKLIAAIGCLAGPQSIGNVLIATVLLGAIGAIVVALSAGRFRETLANSCAVFLHHRDHGLGPHPELNVRNDSMLRLPYALPIAGGCLSALFLLLSGGAIQ